MHTRWHTDTQPTLDLWELDARQSLTVARPAIPIDTCQLLLIVQFIGSPASATAVLALLVVSCRTRTQSVDRKSKNSFAVAHCIGAINNIRRRWTSCTTFTTFERVVVECIKFITHWSLWRKNCVDWINKNWLPWQRPLSDRNPISQQSSTPVRLPIVKIWRK